MTHRCGAPASWGKRVSPNPAPDQSLSRAPNDPPAQNLSRISCTSVGEPSEERQAERRADVDADVDVNVHVDADANADSRDTPIEPTGT